MGNSAIEIARPENLGELLRERVQAAFVTLVPAAQWDQLIEREWRTFFHEEVKESYYGSRSTKPSRLSELLREIISEEVRRHVQPVVEARLNELTWEQVCTAEALSLLEQAGPKTMQEFTRSLVQLAAQEALTLLRQGGH
jgi:hypothetical protein